MRKYGGEIRPAPHYCKFGRVVQALSRVNNLNKEKGVLLSNASVETHSVKL